MKNEEQHSIQLNGQEIGTSGQLQVFRNERNGKDV